MAHRKSTIQLLLYVGKFLINCDAQLEKSHFNLQIIIEYSRVLYIQMLTVSSLLSLNNHFYNSHQAKSLSNQLNVTHYFYASLTPVKRSNTEIKY